MPKSSKETKTSKEATRKSAQRPKVPRAIQARFDQAALDYLKLLQDPCSGPLVHPVMPGAGGGQIARFESFLTLGDGTNDTAFAVHWTPNAMGIVSGNTACATVLQATTRPSSVVATPSVMSDYSTYTPGYNWLRSNASAVRCIAACMQIYTNASEMNRSGFISTGVTTNSLIVSTDQTSPIAIRPNLPVMVRAPESVMETLWSPTPFDANFIDPVVAAASPIGGCGAITACGTGLAVGTGVTIKLTAVYEYQPSQNTGMAATVKKSVETNNTFNDVMRFLERNSMWWFRAGKVVSMLAPGAGAAMRLMG